MRITVIVASHKPYRMPEDSMYLPLHVGRAGKADLGWTGDDSGDNISQKNATFCELTGLYWAWKHLDADAIGLAHYRRHFCATPFTWRERLREFVGMGDTERKWQRVLRQEQAAALLERAPVVVPPRRDFLIESVGDHYAHAHHREDLELMRAILAEHTPEYIPAWKAVLRGRQVHLFNMFIMRRDCLDAYCRWLFALLFTLEQRLDISSYSRNDARVFGFLAERLLDVWLQTNRITPVETPVMFMESQNWLKKGSAVVWRKIRGGKR